jgi:hypothetical protein
MKSDESRSPVKTKHQLDHAVPTVIHHPEEDLPALARWFHQAMEKPVQFWGTVAGLVLLLLGLSVLASGGLSLGKASVDAAWSKLETAKTASDRIEIAKEFPGTPAERWALLQAANEYYDQGINDLPANREVALPTLKKALDQFEKVATEAPKDSPQARLAAFGVARTLEARNELDKAIKQYEKISQTKEWARSEEAHESARLAALLKTPVAVSFYKELYAFKPAEATLPPAGIGNIPLPFGHPPTGGTGSAPLPGSAIEPSPLVIPPLPPETAPAPLIKVEPPATTLKPYGPSIKPPTIEPPSSGTLPPDVFTPSISKAATPGASKTSAGSPK